MYNVRKYLLIHAIVISFVFFLTPTILAASDVERKIEELKQAIRINPDNADVHANLGAAYSDLGMYLPFIFLISFSYPYPFTYVSTSISK